MKKKTKQILVALIMVMIFGMSTFAFVATSATGTTANQNGIKPLTNFVVEGDIDDNLESAYYQGGFTFLKFYYRNDSAELLKFVEALPSILTTPNEQTQLIVQKYNTEENKAIIKNLNTDTELENLTKEKITASLCTSLLVTPVECTLMNITAM